MPKETLHMTATTQPIQITPDWLVAQLQDIISDAPEYVRKGAARLLDSFTAEIAAAAGPNAAGRHRQRRRTHRRRRRAALILFSFFRLSFFPGPRAPKSSLRTRKGPAWPDPTSR